MRTALAFALLLVANAAVALPSDKYANVDSAISAWVSELHSAGSKARCCDLADGEILADTQWDYGAASYRVFLVAPDGHTFADGTAGKWFDVPPDAIVVEPNRLGHALVWARWYFDDDGHVRADWVYILCFLPGAGA